jgi:ABC-type branched-subunit amino acid transport system ATPase component
MTPLLEIQDLYSGYRGVDILKGIRLKVNPGQIVVIIGPNGAGKSTVLKSLFGLATIRSGRVLFQGSDITHLAAEQLVRRGSALCLRPTMSFPPSPSRKTWRWEPLSGATTTLPNGSGFTSCFRR